MIAQDIPLSIEQENEIRAMVTNGNIISRWRHSKYPQRVGALVIYHGNYFFVREDYPSGSVRHRYATQLEKRWERLS
jgi:hypothetical protein